MVSQENTDNVARFLSSEETVELARIQKDSSIIGYALLSLEGEEIESGGATAKEEIESGGAAKEEIESGGAAKEEIESGGAAASQEDSVSPLRAFSAVYKAVTSAMPLSLAPAQVALKQQLYKQLKLQHSIFPSSQNPTIILHA